jgi:GT2 family glycosyltransferase
MNNSPCVFVVIPNRNGVNHLSYSLKSLAKTTYPNYQAILVDDASNDDSLDFIRTHYPNVEIILNQGKRGFAGAANTGIKYALEHGADYIAVFNSDIQVLPEWIEFVIDIFSEHPEVGLVGYTEVPKEREELFYNVRELKLEYKDVKGLPGCLYICASRVFKHVGLFDEKYFMYGEDNDFFSRLTKAGYIIVQTNVPVWHHGEASSEAHKFSATWLAYRNALRFVIKNGSVIEIFRMILSLLNQGCNPFLDREKDDPVFKRMRRYNIPINFILITASCCWSTINIIPTLRSRHEANRRIRGRI